MHCCHYSLSCELLRIWCIFSIVMEKVSQILYIQFLEEAHPSSNSCTYMVQNRLTVHVWYMIHYFHIICSWISMLPIFCWILKNGFRTLVIFSEILLLQSLPYNNIPSNYFLKENLSMQFHVGSSLVLMLVLSQRLCAFSS